MKCNRCGREILIENQYLYLGQTLCEDCYIDIRSPVKACDPWAVYAAKQSRQNAGIKGTEGLTEQQQALYAMIKEKGKVTREDIIAKLNITERELQPHLAMLRYCELIKGYKEGHNIYLVTFDYDE